MHCVGYSCFFCEDSCERVMQFLSSTSEEEEEEDEKRIKKEHFGHLATFCFGTFAMLFHATVSLVVCEST